MTNSTMTEPKLCPGCGRLEARYAAWLDDFDGLCAGHTKASDALLNCREVALMDIRSALAASKAEVERLRETADATQELMLRYESERNHYRGLVLTPAATSAELAADMATVRFFIDVTIAGGANPSGAPQALSRIAAALGLGKEE
jgi:hypothetical protein